MKILHTIEDIHRIFDTQGSSPLLVTCDDFNDWVCKYDRFPKYLFNELIASQFARIFGIKTPETAFIKVRYEDINTAKFPQLNLGWFEKECFGSLYLDNSKEIDYTIDDILGATMFSFNEDTFYITINNSIDYFSIAKDGDDIIAETKIIKRGKQFVNAQCEIWNDSKTRLIARGTSNLFKTSSEI